MKKDEFCEYALSAFRPAESLLKMIPADKLDWKPGPDFMTMGQLICHLGDGIGTELRMLVNNSWPKPEEMSEAMKQGKMPACTCRKRWPSSRRTKPRCVKFSPASPKKILPTKSYLFPGDGKPTWKKCHSISGNILLTTKCSCLHI